MSTEVRDNPERSRFELDVGGEVAFADYRRQNGVLFIRHVEAPIPLRGTGAASRLMQGVAEHARREGSRITPLCGYAHAWLRRHREHHDLLA